MNKLFTRVVSLICVMLTLFGVVSLTASAATTYENDLPTVYLVGQTQNVYNSKGKQVWPVTKDIADILLENRNDLISAFTKSAMDSDWSIYGDALAKALDKSFSPALLDKNGNPKNGTKIKANPEPKVKISNFSLTDYYFGYDPRLDPWETAEELSTYIGKVLKATGKKKVNLIGRCMGGSFISAYLARYGTSKVDTIIHYASAANGSTISSELFAGKFHIDAESINNYANTSMNEEGVSQLLAGLINATYSFNVLGLGTDLISDMIDEMAAEVFPDILLKTYATFPSYWAMVDVEHYEAAKKFVFAGREKEYAGLIKKIDNYHNKVKVNIESDLKKYQKSGVKVAIIAKYNIAFPPYIESYNAQGDGTVSLTDNGFGATGAEYGKSLSLDYLETAKKKGKMKYISDDLIVDTSTCLFPKYTWFVRDIEHGTIPTCINKLMLKILRSKNQVNVNSFEEYPQFTSYSYETKKLTKITSPIPSGSSGVEKTESVDLIGTLKGLLKIILNLLTIMSK